MDNEKRPTVILPGYLAAAREYYPMQQHLQALGFPTQVVPVRVRNWFPTVGGRSMVPILRLLDRTVQETLERYQTDKINLVGHSAGGWIARIYMGSKPYTIHGDVDENANLWYAYPQVSTLVCLGTPHTSYERWTRKNLDFVNNNYPGAFYAPDVRYVCVAGKAIYGKRRPGQWLAFNSYKITCNQGNTWGDGITPISAAHLQGAENLILEPVHHSPKSGTWYGSPEIVKTWAAYLQ
ncbi:alpha/beta hydrolase [Geitlerinema sp. PCC 9228]|jgi:triacylglycerol esterase/lipase EstA (alpha/beta hydrolase family)|uniref:esterase/lipase family protein n=1 Tax=Geitlerinema sp. PCC 9228 TaxID=111611 RepID=UPI0008F99DF2|nr:alpha/beta hydrolase [Geitlerinema sp. PCC 9228]